MPTLPSDQNPGRYLLIASLAQPSVVAILERRPSLEDAHWVFRMHLLSLTRVPIEDLVVRALQALTRGKLDCDAQVLVDATDAGSLSIRMSRQLGGSVFRLIAGPVADQDKRYEDVHCVTDVDVADAVRLTRGRLSISGAIPRVVVERLANQAAERRFALPERPIALAHGTRTGLGGASSLRAARPRRSRRHSSPGRSTSSGIGTWSSASARSAPRRPILAQIDSVAHLP